MERPVALVTGCSKGGIGFAFCENLAARGYIVYATARSLSSMDDLRHPNCRKCVLDVTSDEQVNTVVSKIIEDEGHIDLLINNAGMPAAGPLMDWTVYATKNIFDTNVFSVLRLCRAVIPHMAQRKQGTILNIGSRAGEFAPPWFGIYAATKFSLRTISEVLSLECRPFNISVSHINTGTVQSRILDKQDTYLPPPGSLYGAFVHNIERILEMGKGEGKAMDAGEFVESVLRKTIGRGSEVRKRKIPIEVLAGTGTFALMVLRWLPRSWYFGLIWRVLGKPEVKSKDA